MMSPTKGNPHGHAHGAAPTAQYVRMALVGVATLCTVVWIVNSVTLLQTYAPQRAPQAEKPTTKLWEAPVKIDIQHEDRAPGLVVDWQTARKDVPTPRPGPMRREVRVTPTRETWPMQDKFYTSHFPPNDTSTTIIFNLFKGHPEALRMQLEAAAGQLHVSPPEIWVMCFNSPLRREYEAVVEAFKARTGPTLKSRVVVTASDFNHKFHGRFLLAYMARTKYVLIVDDDKNLDATAVSDYIRHMRMQKGVWGNFGHLRASTFGGYKSWPKHYNNTKLPYAEMDYLSGMWFLEQSWLEYFVKERPPSWETSEDMHLSHVMRKYLNLNTYGGNVSLQVPKLPRKKHAATVGSALNLREHIFDHQLGRGNKIANVDQRIDTLVYAETVDDIEDFMAKLDKCEKLTAPTSLRQTEKASELAPWCHAGRTAAVFRGAKEQDVRGLINAALELCRRTKCEHWVVKPKIKHPIRYFNLREGYGQDSVEIPFQTGASDVMTTMTNLLSNLTPKQLFVPDVTNVHWFEPERDIPGKKNRLLVYHQTVRLALLIHRSSPVNHKWDKRSRSLDASKAYPTLKAYSWRYSVGDSKNEDVSTWKSLVDEIK